MSGPPHDLRDYLLDELTAQQRAEVESHLAHSAEAREELEHLRQAHKALLSVPDEEIPQRIAFVSDKIFELSRLQQLWRELSAGAPRFGLAAAAVLLVLFGGLWTVQPTVTVNETGWQLAFGPSLQRSVPAIAEEVPRPVQGLTEDQVRAVLTDVLEENEARLDARLAEVVAERLQASEARWQRALEALREENVQAWRLMKTELDSLVYNTSAEFRAAGGTR